MASIAKLNATAVLYLQQNNVFGATVHLQMALKHMLENMSVDKAKPQTGDCVEQPKSAFDSDGPSDYLPSGCERDISSSEGHGIPVIYTVHLPALHKEMAVSPDNVFSFFNRAFLFPEGDEETLLAEHGYYHNQAIAIVLYNLGVSYHVIGGQSGDFKHLKTAFTFYEMAMQANNENSTSDRNSELRRYICLALANNLGHIASHCFDFDQARFTQHILRDQLAACHGHPLQLVSRDDFQFFVMNVIFCQGQELRYAPSA